MTDKKEYHWKHCPNCGGNIGCPCVACKVNHPEDEPRMIRHKLAPEVCLESCPHCGFTAHLGWWEDLDYQCVMGTGGWDGAGTIENGWLFPGMYKAQAASARILEGVVESQDRKKG